MELRRVVEQQHVAGLGERVVARGRRGVEGVQGVVPAHGEGVPHPDAQAVEAVEGPESGAKHQGHSGG
jgi:hypothetical protein